MRNEKPPIQTNARCSARDRPPARCCKQSRSCPRRPCHAYASNEARASRARCSARGRPRCCDACPGPRPPVPRLLQCVQAARAREAREPCMMHAMQCTHVSPSKPRPAPAPWRELMNRAGQGRGSRAWPRRRTRTCACPAASDASPCRLSTASFAAVAVARAWCVTTAGRAVRSVGVVRATCGLWPCGSPSFTGPSAGASSSALPAALLIWPSSRGRGKKRSAGEVITTDFAAQPYKKNATGRYTPKTLMPRVGST